MLFELLKSPLVMASGTAEPLLVRRLALAQLSEDLFEHVTRQEQVATQRVGADAWLLAWQDAHAVRTHACMHARTNAHQF